MGKERINYQSLNPGGLKHNEAVQHDARSAHDSNRRARRLYNNADLGNKSGVVYIGRHGLPRLGQDKPRGMVNCGKII